MAPLQAVQVRANNAGQDSWKVDLPSAELFMPVGDSKWCAHPGAPDWLLKRADSVYFHVPTSSLWRRTHKRSLVRVDGDNGAKRKALFGFAAGTPDLLVRSIFKSWAAAMWTWTRRSSDIFFAEDDLSLFDTTATQDFDCTSGGGSRSGFSRGLQLRRAAKGLRHGRRGVSPPPRDGGWSCAAQGWQTHAMAPNWLRKLDESDSTAYYHVPNESLWVEMPTGQFVCVDTYHTALAALISTVRATLLRSCLVGWQSQAKIVKQWRYKINVISRSGTGDVASGPTQPAEAAPLGWMRRSAFLPPRCSSSGISLKARKVTFKEPAGD